MKRLLSCEFNLDTACVELCFSDGSMVSIDTIAVENEVVNNMYQQSELDYLIYNDPAAYAIKAFRGLFWGGPYQSMACPVSARMLSTFTLWDFGTICPEVPAF